MKSFTNSQFFHSTATSKKIEAKLKPKSNVIEIGCVENNKFESISTDMIYGTGMRLYIRVIMNVQLMNFSIIGTVADLIKSDTEKFILELEKDGCEISENIEDLITFSGPSYERMKGRQITSWINIDIPYIDKKLNDINILINKIVGLYQTFCKKQDITGSDIFYIAKYVMKAKIYYSSEALSAIMYANYQKPNSYVKSIGVHINVPEFIDIDYRNFDKATGCDFTIFHNGSEDYNIESIFDDRFRICEFNVQRFVQKDEKLVVSHFVSRSINIFKKDKTQALISRDATDGSIKVNAINISFTEHPKLTTVLSEYIETFFKTNSKIHPKIAKIVSNYVGKSTINKIISKMKMNSEETVQENDTDQKTDEIVVTDEQEIQTLNSEVEAGEEVVSVNE